MVSEMTKAQFIEKSMFSVVRVMSLLVIAFLLFLLAYVFQKGFSVLSWEFLSEMPRNEMTRGGIYPPSSAPCI